MAGKDPCRQRLALRAATSGACADSAMMNSVERSLLSFGVPGRQIIAERFQYD
jgi:ferredoxin-NADP reductase